MTVGGRKVWKEGSEVCMERRKGSVRGRGEGKKGCVWKGGTEV